MQQIRLTKGKIAIVDDEDYDYLNQWDWFSHSNGYAIRMKSRKSIGGRGVVYMHRVIFPPSEGMEVDHINGNKADNRKENLRHCTHAENSRNKKMQYNNKSGFKGAFLRANCNENHPLKYTAQIVVNERAIHLGLFGTLKEAALAYNKAALELYGEFAKLNVVPNE